MGKDPAMPLYVNDWLSSRRVQTMNQFQELAYFRLLCFCWSSGDASLPDDDKQLAVLSRMGEEWFNGSSTSVKECFNKHPTKLGFLTNERLYDLWQERQQWREKCSAAGRKSGRIRGKRKAKVSSTVVELNGNSSSSSSSSTILSLEKKESKKAFTKPTIEEVRSYCQERGNAVNAEKFVAYYESNGWRVGKNPMKNWQAAVRTWEGDGQRYTANGQRPRRRLSERGK